MRGGRAAGQPGDRRRPAGPADDPPRSRRDHRRRGPRRPGLAAASSRVETWYETNPGDNTPAERQERRLPGLRRQVLLRRVRVRGPTARARSARRSAIATTSRATPTTAGSSSTRATTARRRSCSWPTRAGSSTTRSPTTAAGEDTSPDFFWDSAGADHGAAGWTPRDARSPSRRCATRTATRRPGASCSTATIRATSATSIFTARLPRGRQLLHLQLEHARRPAGAARRRTHRGRAVRERPARRASRATGLGTPLSTGDFDGDGRARREVDAPSASTAIDATHQPRLLADRVRRGADRGQRALRALLPREAAVLPRGRRAVLDADPGRLHAHDHVAALGRCAAPARSAALAYTALVAEDRGGGSVILPGPNGSDFADQDFRSWRRHRPRARATSGARSSACSRPMREVEGGGHNRVVRARLPVAAGGARTRHRPAAAQPARARPSGRDLAAEWDGRELSGHAGQLWWSHAHADRRLVRAVQRLRRRVPRRQRLRARRSATGRRYARGGLHVPARKGLLRRLRTVRDRSTAQTDARRRPDLPAALPRRRHGRALELVPSGCATRTTASAAADKVLPRQQLVYTSRSARREAGASRTSRASWARRSTSTTRARAHGASVIGSATLRPTDHLELRVQRQPALAGRGRRRAALGAACSRPRVDRLRATYTFTSRVFVRAIGQYVQTTRDPTLYLSEVARKTRGFSGSALFAYKLNWQTVLFVGYGDNRDVPGRDGRAGAAPTASSLPSSRTRFSARTRSTVSQQSTVNSPQSRYGHCAVFQASAQPDVRLIINSFVDYQLNCERLTLGCSRRARPSKYSRDHERHVVVLLGAGREGVRVPHQGLEDLARGAVAAAARTASIRRASPHSSSAVFIASLMPSVKATSRSPGSQRHARLRVREGGQQPDDRRRPRRAAALLVAAEHHRRDCGPRSRRRARASPGRTGRRRTSRSGWRPRPRRAGG